MTGVHTMMGRYGRLVDERWYGAFVVLLYDVDPPADPPAGARCLVVEPVRYEVNVNP